MDILHIDGRAYPTSTWAGGITRQIAIRPEGAQYADRSFTWRLSSARVDLDESDFTKLQDYRFISVLQGDIQLSHDGGPWSALKPYQVHFFDGGAATRCLGRCTDFNLMLRKGVCQGSLEAKMMPEGGTLTLTKPRGHTLAGYCAEGSAAAETGDESWQLATDDSLLLEGDAGTLNLTSGAGATLMVSRVALSE